MLVRVKTVRAQNVLIAWNAFKVTDPRTLLAYVVSYVKAPSQNMTYYDGRDACGGDGLVSFHPFNIVFVRTYHF